MPTLTPSTPVRQLLEDHPFLLDFLPRLNPRFKLLENPTLRATAARFATLKKVAEVGGLPVEDLMEAIEGEIRRMEGRPVDESSVERPGAGEAQMSRGNGGGREEEDSGPPPEPAPEVTDDPFHVRSRKTASLKSILQDLHGGLPADEARARFQEVVRDVTPQEIGAMEEALIRDGTPVQEIQNLCDLHVSLVRSSLDQQAPVQVPSGHPVHTYQMGNQVVTREANRLGQLCSLEKDQGEGWWQEVEAVLTRLGGIENHYRRKENELFPALERHGVSGPSQVMWGVHDEIRGQLKAAMVAAETRDPSLVRAGIALARSLTEMVYKEEKILLPLALETLSQEEWERVRQGEDELGYGFAEPAGPFPGAPPSPTRPGRALPVVSAAAPAPLPEKEEAYLELGTGKLSLEQVDMILRHLPVDISFVDAHGYVRYYSETQDRLFPRTPGAIGRHVTNCHPPKSVHMVEEILRAFSSGERDVAEFWIQMKGIFIHIRYFAVRNPAGAYLGCLEVSQDVTGIRALEGQRRLLEWS